MLIEAYLDKKFKEVVDNADIVIPQKILKYLWNRSRQNCRYGFNAGFNKRMCKIKKDIFIFEEIEKKAK
ncbi:hypothetical protein [Lebetimonas sp. JS138]|uniref:hypothetical protein n=1 Tax=Lebetimonas sp. JS138 TaxID=990072 RepID=UPI000464093A|nr:hypothetical protein [Lebetimonas sp. JS138]